MRPCLRLASLLALVLLSVPSSGAFAQTLAPLYAQSAVNPAQPYGVEPVERIATVLTGRVDLPDGAPAVGALVLSSAGGRAVTDAAGEFQLEVELSIDSRELQITAASSGGSSGLAASRRVAVPGVGGTNPVGAFHLAASSTCQPGWLPTFGGQPGTNYTIRALAVYADASGPALYLAGEFQVAGSEYALGIAKWDGSTFSRVGTFAFTRINALAVFDDNAGGGPALYAGGMDGLRRWDGSTWTSVGGAVIGEIRSLLVHDDGLGLGPRLFVGGDFSAQSATIQNVGRWNGGTSWSTVGFGVSSPVACLAEYDDGGGRGLYVGGSFVTAGGVPVNRIARWRNGAWSALGSGTNGNVATLAVWGQGPAAGLYVGGSFTQAGGQSTPGLARWNGTTWTALQPPLAATATVSMAVLDLGSGPALYTCGSSCTGGGGCSYSVARFDGTAWSALVGAGVPASGPVHAWIAHDDGSGAGRAAYAAGEFSYIGLTSTGGVTSANCIARWNGSSWSPLGPGLGANVHALAVHDDGLGGGPKLVAGGNFYGPSIGIRSWNGSAWSAVGVGFGGGGFPTCEALLTHDDGTGPALFAAGGFFYINYNQFVGSVARWNGSTWSGLNGGVASGQPVHALAAYDDGLGGGRKLYAGGAFTAIGGVPASRVARWNGVSWSGLGSGVNGEVYALTEYDDGTGMALYAGGSFTTAGGMAASSIAKWNGTSWSPVGSGTNGIVYVLEVLDVGGGSALYAGGSFTSAGGTTASRIARWNGSTWTPLAGGSPNGPVKALVAYDDGTGAGPALYAGGNISSAGGVAVNGVARWSAGVWSPLGTGTTPGYVHSLTTFDDGLGMGECLYVGGEFMVSDGGDSFLARWGGCDVPMSMCTAQLTAPPALTLSDCNSGAGTTVSYSTTSTAGVGTWTLTPPPDFPFADGWNLSLTPWAGPVAFLDFSVNGTSTSGSYDVVVRWDGTCNGLPVTASRIVTCTLLTACPCGVAFCFGDGSGSACPCGNVSATGAGVGCLNSLGTGGRLRATGVASIGGDNVVLRGTEMPNSSALYFQGTTQQSGGAGALFGDGLRCTAGSTLRLGAKVNAGGTSEYPSGADDAISVRGGVLSPGVRTYQVWYRNAAAFCTASTFNLTNGLSVTWLP